MDDFENPYAPPQSELSSKERHLERPDEGWRDGKVLVARKGAELPDRCLKCNAPADGYRFSRTLSWVRPAWLLLFLISPLLLVLVYLIVRRRAKVTVGLCEHHRRIRTRAIARGWLTALAGIATMISAAAVPDNLAPVAAIGGFCLVVAGLIGGAIGSRVLIVRRIDKHFVWLNKVSPEYLAAFADWNA